ncbi:LytTR family DNA-binding domain-containing protein [Variovorax sp. RT4R15]|uniref:LytTR family DNA-binding domain-containing protein n=1 Tax=Variovorax sp. RT4R15 TaxID=3443737 RepID=UPI003F474B23
MNPATDAPRNLFERYRPYQRRVLVAAWITIMALQGAFNSAVAVIDARAARRGLPAWQPVTWELSSQLVLLLLVPAVIAFERRFPLGLSTLRSNLPWHLAASVVFSLVHVAAMVGLRHLVHAGFGAPYDFGDWLARWPYEYLKDVRTYALFIAAVLAYRLFMLRLQGEARVLDAPEPARDTPPASVPPQPPQRPERFLVRKLRREFLIAAADIDWLQAQGNYVGLHVNGHDYLLRATLSDFLIQLDPSRFARVHRSHAVNLDRIREIESLDGGDARLHMHDGTVVPCSRRYRPGHNAVSGR